MTVRPLQSAWRFSRNELSGKPGAVHVEHPAATKGGWRRPVGLYVALCGFLAAFQHVVQRHLFQARSLDVSSGLVLIVYVVIGALGVHWFRCAYARVEDMPAQRTETTSS